MRFPMISSGDMGLAFIKRTQCALSIRWLFHTPCRAGRLLVPRIFPTLASLPQRYLTIAFLTFLLLLSNRYPDRFSVFHKAYSLEYLNFSICPFFLFHQALTVGCSSYFRYIFSPVIFRLRFTGLQVISFH